MRLSEEDVRHVAQLARLKLSQDEIDAMRQDLSKILDHVDALSALDTSGVEATTQVANQAAILRPDIAVDAQVIESALKGAPRAVDSAFAVPAFVEDKS